MIAIYEMVSRDSAVVSFIFVVLVLFARRRIFDYRDLERGATPSFETLHSLGGFIKVGELHKKNFYK